MIVVQIIAGRSLMSILIGPDNVAKGQAEVA